MLTFALALILWPIIAVWRRSVLRRESGYDFPDRKLGSLLFSWGLATFGVAALASLILMFFVPQVVVITEPASLVAVRPNLITGGAYYLVGGRSGSHFFYDAMVKNRDGKVRRKRFDAFEQIIIRESAGLKDQGRLSSHCLVSDPASLLYNWTIFGSADYCVDVVTVPPKSVLYPFDAH